ncbi:porin [Polynucleobacter paneuropaeus]|uniref:porin n=1 Tax=Polynucleobacter paneuropaeus TaxID=2527775 RepID=UPI000DBF0634|nr:porin [Polynucleobacter paneuropaeus]AWW45449.1 porin [Polynucleobacter paneuropaeus]
MKKSLLALAAVGAFASAAQAQSSVTVYGILDMGLVGGNNTATQGGAYNTTTGPTKTTGLGIAQSAESTSRLGFKGNEDLGGGTSAVFTMEVAFAPSATTTATSQTPFYYTRQAFVGVKKNGVGSLLAGTQNTTIYDAVLTSDPSGVNNMGGNLVTLGAIGPQGQAGTSTGGSASQYGLANNSAYNTRVENALQFKSDTFSGFGARAMVVAYNANSTDTTQGGAAAGVGGQNNVNGYGLGLDYNWNKLNVTANVQQFNAVSNANLSNTQAVLFGSSATAVSSLASPGVNVKDAGQYYAANYDFGILKAFYQYVNRKGTQANDANYYTKYSANQIGVNSYVTPAIQVWASAAIGKYQAQGAFTTSGAPTYIPGSTNLNGFQLGSNYWLSKRTNLYAIYGQMAQSNQAMTSATGPTSAYNMNNYAVGVRHTF